VTKNNAGDGQLVERCLAGDGDAWEDLVRRYRRLVYSVPARMGIRGADADEVFQMTYVTLLEKLHTVRDRERIGLWLAVTARRKAIDLIRRGSRDVELPDEIDDTSPEPLPIDELIRVERQASVREAFGNLGGRCRDLLGALYYEDPTPSYKTIADRFGVPHGSLGPTRARCIAKLRKLLAEARN